MSLTPYRGLPGVKGTEPSGYEGRDHMALRLGHRQAEVIADIRANGPANADRIAARLGRHINPVRPRVTELRKMGVLTKTGEMAVTEFGRSQPIVRLSTPQELADAIAKREASQ